MLYSQRHDNQVVVIELVPFSKRDEAARSWQKLEQDIKNIGLTHSWDWIKTWLDNYSDIVEPIFAFGKCHDQLIGAALITRATQRIWGIPISLIFLGTTGESREFSMYVENNRLLVAPENLDAFAQSLIHTLKEQFAWSALWLNGFVPEHAEALMSAGASVRLPFSVEQRRCPAFDFQKAADASYTDIISALGKNTRYNIRRSLRLFESDFGLQQIDWAETEEQAKDILRELINMHQKRWQRVNKPGSFRTDRVRRFHEDLISMLGLWPKGSLIVFRLKYGNTTIGCLFNFVDKNGHVLSYKSGFPLFEDNRLKPGLVTHAVCMTQCWHRGLVERELSRQSSHTGEEKKKWGLAKYDFLVGEALYKDWLSNTEGSLTWATAQRGPRLWLIEKVRSPLRLAKSLIVGQRRQAANGRNQEPGEDD
jgi:hypothetical protein